MATGRAHFGSRFGVLMAAAGSAVGLGNIWRFPVETGNNGGAAFILVYLISIALLGIPLMVAEFMVGRHAHCNTAFAYASLTKSRLWSKVGFIGVAASTLILCYYIVVAGWVLKYLVLSIDGTLDTALRSDNAQDYTEMFSNFTTNPIEPVAYLIIFMLLCHIAIASGVQKGIEKFSKIFMPALFIIMIVLVIFSLFAPEAEKGLKFLFHPDFSKLTAKAVLSAVAQSFYSLSLCMGCLCTYASYFNKDVKIVNSAVNVALIDTVVAIMAGVIVFPAVFSAGINPQAGASLVFIALPCAFEQAFGSVPLLSYVVSVLFYALLVLATLTSAISLHEVSTAYISEAWRVKRKWAATIVSLFCIAGGIVCSLSMGLLGDWQLGGKNIFDLFDYVTTTLMLPLCGVLTAIFIGWKIKKHIFHDELTNYGRIKSTWSHLLLWLLRWAAPILLAAAFLNGLGAI